MRLNFFMTTNCWPLTSKQITKILRLLLRPQRSKGLISWRNDFSPVRGNVIFCGHYIRSFSPSWNDSLGANYEIARKESDDGPDHESNHGRDQTTIEWRTGSRIRSRVRSRIESRFGPQIESRIKLRIGPRITSRSYHGSDHKSCHGSDNGSDQGNLYLKKFFKN